MGKTASADKEPVNPRLASIPTVGYMGHRPVYRKPIGSIGSLEGQHFDLTTTKAGAKEGMTEGVAQGFVETLKKDVRISDFTRIGLEENPNCRVSWIHAWIQGEKFPWQGLPRMCCQ